MRFAWPSQHPVRSSLFQFLILAWPPLHFCPAPWYSSEPLPAKIPMPRRQASKLKYLQSTPNLATFCGKCDLPEMWNPCHTKYVEVVAAPTIDPCLFSHSWPNSFFFDPVVTEQFCYIIRDRMLVSLSCHLIQFLWFIIWLWVEGAHASRASLVERKEGKQITLG